MFALLPCHVSGSPPVPDVVPDSSPSNRNSSIDVDEPAPELPPKPGKHFCNLHEIRISKIQRKTGLLDL